MLAPIKDKFWIILLKIIGSMLYRSNINSYSKIEIIMFEPNPLLAIKIRRKIETKKFQNLNITFEPIAVSKTTGNISFTVSNNEKHSQYSHIGLEEIIFNTTIYTVDVNTLNNIKRKYKIQHVDLLKIDTEGYDSWVLEGSAELLPLTDIIIYECHQLQDRIKSTFYETQLFLG